MNVLWNGQVKSVKEVVISPLDHGFLYGMGLFETFRTYGGRPWLMERHAARLAGGCRLLGMEYEPDIRRLRDGIDRLLEAEGLQDGYIRWSVSAGEGAVGLPSGPYAAPVEVVYAKALAPDPPAARAGKTVRLMRLRRSSPEGGVRLKSFHYMNNILAKRELAAGGADPAVEGLFLDAQGCVCEGIVSNIFWLKDGEWHTPSLETGPLPGITREYVMQMAARMGLQVREGCYGLSDVAAAEEVFLTNSIQELVPVAQLQDADGKALRIFDTDAPGSAARKLMGMYRLYAQGRESDEPDIL